MSAESAVYLDYNATTPLASEVAAEISVCLTKMWHNPSSGYVGSRNAKEAIETARIRIKKAIGGHSDGKIVFTSGGTESNHLALHSALESYRSQNTTMKPHVIASSIEHETIDQTLKSWQNRGEIEVTFVECSGGVVCIDKILDAIRANTALVTVMMANNETGVVQPIQGIGEVIRTQNMARIDQELPIILFHSDGAQALGKINVDMRCLGVDYFTVVGHKFYGPRIGALYATESSPIYPLFLGGGQEMGYRAGTENTALIVGLALAAELATSYRSDDEQEMLKLREMLTKGLEKELGSDVFVDNFAHCSTRLPNTLSAAFKGVNGTDVLKACEGEIEASTRSACHTGMCLKSSSRVLWQSDVSEMQIAGTVRLSVGRNTTKSDIAKAIQALARAYKNIKNP